MNWKDIKSETWEHAGSKIAVEPAPFYTVKVYVDGKLLVKGPRDMIRYFLQRAKAHIINKKGNDL